MSERELRIGDAERTAAADELAEHYAQGRLSTDEHHERLDRIWAARTPSDLTSVFGDLPGSAYRAPASYATADTPAAGSDRPRTHGGQRPFPGPPFGRPPFGRPPFGRPPSAGRGMARRFGLLPAVVRVALIALLVVLFIAHLPLILMGLVIWLVLTHKLRHAHAYQRRC
jgi:phage shock protein PspC (stress-responsive transcriptional regulator)